MPGPTKENTHKGRFPKGVSGNPAGRPQGSRNRSSVFFEELLSGQGEALIQKAIELAMKGDTAALRLCLDRIAPARKERTIELSMPAVTGTHGIATALSALLSAATDGRITPGEAECLSGILETQLRVVEFEALEQRISALEKAQAGASPETETNDTASLDWVSRNYANPASEPSTQQDQPQEPETKSPVDSNEPTA